MCSHWLMSRHSFIGKEIVTLHIDLYDNHHFVSNYGLLFVRLWSCPLKLAGIMRLSQIKTLKSVKKIELLVCAVVGTASH